MAENPITIDNDATLRRLLHRLEPKRQREACLRLVRSVLPLTDDARVLHAIETATRPDVGNDELEQAYKAARAATIDSRTRCGADCNWEDQAKHFVARAAAAAVAPPGRCKADDPPWLVVMSCRMARDCALLAADADEENREAETQYRTVQDYLAQARPDKLPDEEQANE